MRKLWFRPRSRVVTLVYFNDAQNRTKEHIETLIVFFLKRHWTRSGHALACDALRAITASLSLKPELISRQAEIDRKVAAWLASRDEDRREAAQRYQASRLPRLDP